MGKRQSQPWIVSDELCSLIEPLLPVPGPKLVEGRPRVPDRQSLCGTLFVLHTGIQWEYLPQELGIGWGVTCWLRLAAGPPGRRAAGPPGTRPVCGTSCMWCCWRSCGRRTSWTGSGR
ncbi:transposase [Streptomyces sp. PA5.6]|uniref:transposase n=1 Tax=Streptomyces sp. PA5.6 TaxID=3035651 RepID=UPI003904BA63